MHGLAVVQCRQAVGKILEIEGDDDGGPTDDGSCQHMTVIGIGHCAARRDGPISAAELRGRHGGTYFDCGRGRGDGGILGNDVSGYLFYHGLRTLGLKGPPSGANSFVGSHIMYGKPIFAVLICAATMSSASGMSLAECKASRGVLPRTATADIADAATRNAVMACAKASGAVMQGRPHLGRPAPTGRACVQQPTGRGPTRGSCLRLGPIRS